MKKLTKGAIAAGAAGMLLLGGLGSIAFWSDSENVAGGEVNAGTLGLGTVICDPTWVHAADDAPVTLIVPGDTISKDCTFDITATGDNLEAELTIPATTITAVPSDTTLDTIITATYEISDSPIPAVITSANNGQTVTGTIQVEFPFGDEIASNANDMRSIVATLDEITVTLIQTES